MSDWTTSSDDLRRLLSDGPTDRYRARKRLFGELNGTNVTFRSLEFRRITDFTTASAPLGVYNNGILVLNTDISADYPSTGEVVLAVAPVDGDVLEASYFIQWFIDSELEDFVLKAANWLGFGSTTTSVPDGLRPSALSFAASQAYLKMAIRWREQVSEMYKVEDAPSKDVNSQTQEFLALSKEYQDRARNLRNDYYTRQGQNLQPLFSSGLAGNIRDVAPRR